MLNKLNGCLFLFSVAISTAAIADDSQMIQQCIDENYEYVKTMTNGLSENDANELLNVSGNADCALVVIENNGAVWCRPYLTTGQGPISCDEARDLKQQYYGKFPYKVFTKDGQGNWQEEGGSDNTNNGIIITEGNKASGGTSANNDIIIITNEE